MFMYVHTHIHTYINTNIYTYRIYSHLHFGVVVVLGVVVGRVQCVYLAHLQFVLSSGLLSHWQFLSHPATASQFPIAPKQPNEQAQSLLQTVTNENVHHFKEMIWLL